MDIMFRTLLGSGILVIISLYILIGLNFPILFFVIPILIGSGYTLGDFLFSFWNL